MDFWIIFWATFLTYLKGPAQPYSDCCAYVNDLDNDGDVDLHDVAILLNGWACNPPPDFCGYVYVPTSELLEREAAKP